MTVTHIAFGSFTAIPAASFVVVRRLHIITKQNGIDLMVKNVSAFVFIDLKLFLISFQKSGLVIDLLICFGCPIINMLLCMSARISE